MSDNLKRIIREVASSMDIYTIGVFIKSDKSFISKQDLSNKLRAIPSVLTIKFVDDERLDRLSAKDVEYSYVFIRYIGTHNTPKEDLTFIKSYIVNGQDDVNLDKIQGILKLDFRIKTLEKQ